AHGSQVNAPSAPNQSLAPQQMFQPFSDATNATKMDNETDRFRPRATKNAPALRTARCAVETAASCCEIFCGRLQTHTISALIQNASIAAWTFRDFNAQRPTPNAQRPTLTTAASFRVCFRGSNAGENSDAGLPH